jgi:tetratricopeptide (TPR) repeat protein
MKKKVLTALTVILLVSISLHAQTNNANQDYINAVKSTSPGEQAKQLKAYLAKYEGKGTQYENYVQAYLCTRNYPGKTARETIKYGEKALALGGLDDPLKFKVLLNVSNFYSQLGQNLEKAKSYASKALEIAKANKNKNTSSQASAQWRKLEGACYFALGQAQDKSKDLKSAVSSYIQSHKILKNPQILTSLKKVGTSLYRAGFYKEAEITFEFLVSTLKDFPSLNLYARILHRNKKKEEALKYYKQAYAKQKNGGIAYNIGIILADKAKTDLTFSKDALRFLLDASFLSPPNSKKAMELAESLFFTSNKDLRFNENVKEIQKKSKNLEKLTKTFNKKFGEKDEEDLSEAETKEMENILAQLEAGQKALEKLEEAQKVTVDKFTQLIEETKKRLGIKTD